MLLNHLSVEALAGVSRQLIVEDVTARSEGGTLGIGTTSPALESVSNLSLTTGLWADQR